jgi:parallel beta-helix repeat protein
MANQAIGQKTSYLIAIDKLYIDATDPVYKDVKAGDTLLFAAGNRNYLLIKNFQGQSGKPIVMMNTGGDVIIDTDNYYGISIQNCRYLKFTGTGDSGITYGFKIKRVANGAGMGIGELSSDFEIDHVSIENCLIAGLYAKTDPDCSLKSVRGNFTQYNTIIHDNYIANVGNEGMYIGCYSYLGQTYNCNGQNIVLYPSLLDGVKIYNNTVKYAGWDGIQVSSASKNCQIYNNTILSDSQSETDGQMSGILMGGGTKGDCYNNFISQGKGDGIENHGLGGSRIYNNIIVEIWYICH